MYKKMTDLIMVFEMGAGGKGIKTGICKLFDKISKFFSLNNR